MAISASGALDASKGLWSTTESLGFFQPLFIIREEVMTPTPVDVRCPSCHAPVAGDPKPGALVTCDYCHGTFHMGGRRPVATRSAGHTGPASSRRLIAAALAGLVIVGGLAAAIVWQGGDAPDPENAAIRASVRRSVQRSLAKATSGVDAAVVAMPETEEPEPEPEPKGEMIHHHTFALGKHRYLLGELKNTGEVALQKPRITVVMRDGAGKELNSDYGFAEKDVIAPGESSPVKILLKKPPDYTSATFEMDLRPATYAQEQAQGLRLEAQDPEPASFGKYLVFKGKVHNEGKRTAAFVKVEIAGLDADDKLVGLHTTYIAKRKLPPGELGRYQAQVLFFAPAKRVAYRVTGTVDKE